MNGLRSLLLAALMALLAGCETSGGMLLTYGAQGTKIQAERLVAKVYGLPGQPLPYGGPDIDNPLKRMQQRWPQLKTELDQGSVGFTDTGYVAIREAGNKSAELKQLVRAENTDRQILYRGMTDAVGHNTEALAAWIAYTEDSFAEEWIRQAPTGWWLFDSEQGWRRKPAEEKRVAQ